MSSQAGTNKSTATLYYARSGNSLRAAIGVELSGIACTRIEMDLVRREHKSKAYLRLNPAGTVPVLVERTDEEEKGLVITQSGAILNYLLETYAPAFIPQDPRQRVEGFAAFCAAISDVAVQNALQRYMDFHRASQDFLLHRLLVSLRASAVTLERRDWLCGDRPTLADFALYPTVHMRRSLLSTPAGFSALIAWADRVAAIPAVARAIAYAGVELADEAR